MTQSLSERFPGQMVPVKVIRLTRGQVTIIDPEDLPLVSGYTWSASKGRNTYYAVTSILHPGGGWEYDSYGNRRRRRTLLSMHTLLTGYKETDHSNGNGRDNRRNNLRDVTRSQNTSCARKRMTNTSGHAGISRSSKNNKWMARIGIDYQRHYLGLYDDYDTAVEAYHSAADLYFGEFAPHCCDARKAIA